MCHDPAEIPASLFPRKPRRPRNQIRPVASVGRAWATQKWKSGGPASLPIVLEVFAEMAASKGNDSVCLSDGPEHAGLLEA